MSDAELRFRILISSIFFKVQKNLPQETLFLITPTTAHNEHDWPRRTSSIATLEGKYLDARLSHDRSAVSTGPNFFQTSTSTTLHLPPCLLSIDPCWRFESHNANSFGSKEFADTQTSWKKQWRRSNREREIRKCNRDIQTKAPAINCEQIALATSPLSRIKYVNLITLAVVLHTCTRLSHS